MAAPVKNMRTIFPTTVDVTTIVGGGGVTVSADNDAVSTCSFTGASLKGYTTGGILSLANQSTSGFSPVDKIGVFQMGDNAGATSGDAYTDTGLASWNNRTIDFDIACLPSSGIFTIPIIHLIFGADVTGSGVSFRLDGRNSGTNYSGLEASLTWISCYGPTSGLLTTTSTWYHVHIAIDSTSANASVFINGVFVASYAITTHGSFFGYNTSNGNIGGYFANVVIV